MSIYLQLGRLWKLGFPDPVVYSTAGRPLGPRSSGSTGQKAHKPANNQITRMFMILDIVETNFKKLCWMQT